MTKEEFVQYYINNPSKSKRLNHRYYIEGDLFYHYNTVICRRVLGIYVLSLGSWDSQTTRRLENMFSYMLPSYVTTQEDAVKQYIENNYEQYHNFLLDLGYTFSNKNDTTIEDNNYSHLWEFYNFLIKDKE